MACLNQMVSDEIKSGPSIRAAFRHLRHLESIDNFRDLEESLGRLTMHNRSTKYDHSLHCNRPSK